MRLPKIGTLDSGAAFAGGILSFFLVQLQLSWVANTGWDTEKAASIIETFRANQNHRLFPHTITLALMASLSCVFTVRVIRGGSPSFSPLGVVGISWPFACVVLGTYLWIVGHGIVCFGFLVSVSGLFMYLIYRKHKGDLLALPVNVVWTINYGWYMVEIRSELIDIHM